jgi:cytochrome c553
MKKFYVASVIVCMVVVFSYCKTSKKVAAAPAPAAITFEGNVKTIIAASCAPCHIPSKGGNKKPLDNYDNAKSEISDIIRRIELNPTDRGFMPMRNAKLSDADIAAFKQWRDAGMSDK